MGSNVPADEYNKDDKPLKDAFSLHQKALDDLVNVNSLFTMAVFVGLSFSSRNSLEDRSVCRILHVTVARRVVFFEVISFACYLLSSLVAKALKMHLNTHLFSHIGLIKSPWRKFLRSSMLSLSTSGSVLGCIFLTISMVDVVRMRLGKLSCGQDSIHAAGGLIAIVSLALAIYIPFTVTAIVRAERRLRADSVRTGESSAPAGDDLGR